MKKYLQQKIKRRLNNKNVRKGMSVGMSGNLGLRKYVLFLTSEINSPRYFAFFIGFTTKVLIVLRTSVYMYVGSYSVLRQSLIEEKNC